MYIYAGIHMYMYINATIHSQGSPRRFLHLFFIIQRVKVNFAVLDGLIFFNSHLPNQKHSSGLQQGYLSESTLFKIYVSYYQGMFARNLKGLFSTLQSPTLVLPKSTLEISQNHGITESQITFIWKGRFRSLSPTVYPVLPSSPPNHVPQCHIYTYFILCYIAVEDQQISILSCNKLYKRIGNALK